MPFFTNPYDTFKREAQSSQIQTFWQNVQNMSAESQLQKAVVSNTYVNAFMASLSFFPPHSNYVSSAIL